MENQEELHYPDQFIKGLQAIWGQGFLSPGGPQEVDVLLKGISLKGKHVLDIGCGVGGIDVLLVQTYGAAKVTALDVEPQLIRYAEAQFKAAGLDHVIDARLVSPGPVPLPEGSVDVVFSKDAMLHIPDKKALYQDILKILRTGGVLVAGDWLRGGPEEGPVPEELKSWCRITGLNAAFATPGQTELAMRQSGFSNVRIRDRHDWYIKELDKERALLEGDAYAVLEKAIGKEAAENRIESYKIRKIAVEAGALRPCHLYGEKTLNES